MANALRFLFTLSSSPSSSTHPAVSSPLPGPPRIVRSLLASRSSLTSISIAFTIASTSFPSSPPSTLATTLLACSAFPTITSQRGVSGIQTIITAWNTAGTAPSPTIQRQAVSSPPYSPRSQPMTYAATWPSVTKITFIVTNWPRIAAGASSARYSGVTALAAPTPMPTTDRPKVMANTE